MRATKLIFSAFSVTLLLSGCGTIHDGQTQEITLETQGAYEAECVIDNGVRYVVQNDEKFTVQRSNKPLQLDCYAAGNRHVTKTVESVYNPWSVAVPPSALFDHFSGALYEYPSIIVVDFMGVPTGYELPEYHNKDVPNPYTQPIEEYKPGTARIGDDTAYIRRGVEKRDPAADSNPFIDPSSGGAGVSAAAPSPEGTSADSLTRSMNPRVFNN